MSQQMLGMNDYSSWMNSKNTVLSCESEFTKPFNAGALESMCEKHQIAEEPYNGKLLRAVLKSRGEGRPLSLYQNPLLTEQIRNITNSFNSSTGNIDNKITQNIFK